MLAHHATSVLFSVLAGDVNYVLLGIFRYYMPSQENFVVHHLPSHGQQGPGSSGQAGSITTGGASSLNPVALLTTTRGSCTGASVSNTLVSSTTPTTSSSSSSSASASASEENDDEGIGSSLADLDSLTDLLPMMAPDLVCITPLFPCYPFFLQSYNNELHFIIR